MKRKIVDLTMTIDEGMQTFPAPWHPFVEVTQLGRHGIENRETRKLVLGIHTGTHIDAPRHFIPGGGTVDHIPLEQINGRAQLLDLTQFGPFEEVDVETLKLAIGDRSAERLLLRFDWCRTLGTMRYYTDQPWLAEDATQYLVDKGCRLLGMDLPMPDNPKNGKNSDRDSPNHKILLGNGVVILEYLVNLRDIGASEFDLVVAPLKIRDGDGAPGRCFAIIDDGS